MNVTDIIDKFGGTCASARRFGVTPQAVSGWKRNNRFPSWLHMRVAQEAKLSGIAIDERIFSGTTKPGVRKEGK